MFSFGGASDRGPYFTLLNFGEILLREGVNDSPNGCPSLHIMHLFLTLLKGVGGETHVKKNTDFLMAL